MFPEEKKHGSNRNSRFNRRGADMEKAPSPQLALTVARTPYSQKGNEEVESSIANFGKEARATMSREPSFF
jgi:hypothetical protein